MGDEDIDAILKITGLFGALMCGLGMKEHNTGAAIFGAITAGVSWAVLTQGGK